MNPLSSNDGKTVMFFPSHEISKLSVVDVILKSGHILWSLMSCVKIV
jgi:hypothetical protein